MPSRPSDAIDLSALRADLQWLADPAATADALVSRLDELVGVLELTDVEHLTGGAVSLVAAGVHPTLGPVVLKVPHDPDLARRESEVLERRAAAGQPAVLPVTHGDGWLLLPRVDGRPATELPWRDAAGMCVALVLDDARSAGVHEPFDLQSWRGPGCHGDAGDLWRHATSALRTSESVPFLHGDVLPKNVLVTARGPVLLDPLGRYAPVEAELGHLVAEGIWSPRWTLPPAEAAGGVCRMHDVDVPEVLAWAAVWLARSADQRAAAGIRDRKVRSWVDAGWRLLSLRSSSPD